MNLTAADVAEILRLVEESNFDEMSLELDGLKLNFKRGSDGAGVQPAVPAVSPAAAASAPVPAAAPAPAPRHAHPGMAADPNVLEVRSPMLGTFYRAPKPAAPKPYRCPRNCSASLA